MAHEGLEIVIFRSLAILVCVSAGAAVAILVPRDAHADERIADAQGQSAPPHLPPPSTILPLHHGADGRIEIFDPTEQQGTGERRCSAEAICVGSGQAFATLSAALAVAREGDVIEIVAATYHETARITAKNVTLRGILGRPHFDCAGLRPAGDKACLLLAGDGITLENLEISGGVIAEELGANGACIRNEPNKSFTLKRILCHGSQDGVLSDGGNIVIENSEFYDNGWTGLTHNIYLGGNCSVTVRGSIFRDARIGHEFKSRCAEADISDSTFRSTKGSRNLDISDGGAVTLYRSTLVKTPGAENYEIIGFAPESCAHPGDMVLKEVRIVNSQPQATIRNYDKCTGHPIILEGVTVEGIAPKQMGFIKSLGGAR
jgi:parallel beta helix pectate lyase-like protein